MKGKGAGRHAAEEAARSMLPGIRFTQAAPDVGDTPLLQYLADFWKDGSPYVRECTQVRKKPLSARYLRGHRDDTRLHIEPFPGFQGIILRQLTPGLIRDWMTWAAEKGLKGGRINKVMEAMRGAVKYAFQREEISRDPFRNIGKAPDTRKEKGVLTPVELAALIRAPVTDPRGRLAVLLGALCGLRLGEVRGLLWGDIGDGIITVRHNFIDEDGLKAPKCGSTGLVPFTESVGAAIEEVHRVSVNPGPERYVMESLKCPGKPCGKGYFEQALQRELETIGIPGKRRPHLGKKSPEGYVDEQRRRNLTFHGLRHTFVTLGRLAGISDLEIQALARHKSGAMMERYSHAGQVLDFAAAREKLEKAINT
ncbi:MAG: site-specific integrase [Treponema sp.]|nr:site-specific integrase [Treponema sp.]